MAEDIKKEEQTENAETAEETAEEVVEETAEAETEAEESAEGEEPKKGFKRKKKDKKDEMIEELNDRVIRQMAEFENFRKRTDKEKAAMFDMGAKAIVEKMLPVLDNFERGFANVPDDPEAKAFATGMEMIYKQMVTALTDAGLAPIEAEGAEFNPDFHNAVMQVSAADGQESGMVAQELQKGYTFKDSVVRHSMVSVVE